MLSLSSSMSISYCIFGALILTPLPPFDDDDDDDAASPPDDDDYILIELGFPMFMCMN